MKPAEMWYKRLLANSAVEIRVIFSDDRKPMSGYFDNWKDMRKQLLYAGTLGGNIYTTINPLKQSATNGNLKPYQRATRDTDISSIKTIFFDFDPVRDTGEPATCEQIKLAVAQAEKLCDYLEGEGWGIPTIALSGNGSHLMYSTDMTLEQAAGFHGLYDGLKKRFTTDDIDFDVSVKNPARIARAYGTKNIKSGRASSCTTLGTETPADVVVKTITKLTPPKTKTVWVKPENEEKTGDYIKNWDIVGAFQKAGLYIEPSTEHGKHFVRCPWESSHTTISSGEVVIWDGEWAQFNCLHSHCSERDILDVINQLGE